MSDPARRARRRPQARPAGSLTPRMSVSPRGPVCHEKAARFVKKNWSQIVTRSESASGHDFVLMSASNVHSHSCQPYAKDKHDDPLDIIARGLADVPVMPMNGKHPSDATRRLFEIDWR